MHSVSHCTGAQLVFAPDRSHPNYEAAPDKLLGGPALVVRPNDDDGTAQFTLWLWEPSAKHNEREFAVRFVPLNSDKEPVVPDQRFVSDSFYAFSHARVLKRRRDVYLRAINKACTPASGGERMFVVGRGFIDSVCAELRWAGCDGFAHAHARHAAHAWSRRAERRRRRDARHAD